MRKKQTDVIKAQKTAEPARQPEQQLVGQVAPVALAAYRRVQTHTGAGWTPGAAADLLVLQRTVGNRGVQRLLARRSNSVNGLQRVQRQPAASGQPAAQQDSLTAPLTDSEWQSVSMWLSRGEVGIDPLTDNADHNADLVAAAIFCQRALFTPGFGAGEDPLLCVIDDVTIADARVQALKQQVTARGPIIHWPAVPTANRLVYVMNLLIDTYHYPVNGAAGIVGNLMAESGVLPSRIEGSAPATPLRAPNAAGKMTDFSPDEVMNRGGGTGPRPPGVGLAQWTTPARRAGLFQRTAAPGGRPRQLGSSILFNMDAQVEYLVSELQARAGLNARLMAPGVALNDASDDVVFEFEVPRKILDAARRPLPRTDPAVQAVFAQRRANGQRALQAYQAARQP